MKRKYIHTSGFTLIEIIIAMTVFGIIMVSVLSIFLFSSQMSTRVEINRIMQENIKNVTEDIAENMRKSSLAGTAADSGAGDCTMGLGSGTKLCLENGIEYSIGYFDTSTDSWKRQNTIAECQDITKPNCHIIKADGSSIADEYYPLSNSFSHFEDIRFTITNDDMPKLNLNMTVRASVKKGLLSEIVENSVTHIQTTLSERIITTQ